MCGLQSKDISQLNGSLAASCLSEMRDCYTPPPPPLTEGLLAHAHFNHDPLHRSSQDKKEGQEPVDAESLLPRPPLQNPPHLGPGKHARPRSWRGERRRSVERRELSQPLDWSAQMKPKLPYRSLWNSDAKLLSEPRTAPPRSQRRTQS
ncbi:hypothetical protein CB1_000460023 [Camelus ferus]|nr:hypothetical protein CB1_000460023 [Camelus ferus]